MTLTLISELVGGAPMPSERRMNRPEGAQPFYVDERGRESPLFVPPSWVDEARRQLPGLWIEPTPFLQTREQPSDRT
jgi:hypothetical protein